MQNETQRLSLDDFKAKSTTAETQQELEKITGGVLGACHCYTPGPDIWETICGWFN